METKHTPAPWTIEEKEIVPPIGAIETELRIVSPASKVATIHKFAGKNQSIKQQEEAFATAKLIAAAPELLEALKYVKQRIEDSEEWWMDSPNRGGFDMEIIDSAVKKATE